MQHSSHSRKGFIIVIAIPFMLAGIFLIGRSLNQFYTWFASGNWPVVEASVIEAELFHVGKHSRDGATTGIRGSFSYQFNNQPYTSTQFDITGGSNKDVEDKKTKLAVLLEAKAQGKKLQAYVNPANPSEAYIFREISFDLFGFIIIGLISLGLGWLLGRGSQFWPGSSSRQTADSVK